MSYSVAAMSAASNAVSAPIHADDRQSASPRSLEDRAEARHHVDAGGHHRRGVDRARRPEWGPPSRPATTRREGSERSSRSRRRTSRRAAIVAMPAVIAPAASLICADGERSDASL